MSLDVIILKNLVTETSAEIDNIFFQPTGVGLYDCHIEDLIFQTDLVLETIAVSNHENKVFNNCSFHTTQIIQIMNGKWKRSGYTKFMDPDGDYFFVEYSGEKSAVVKFLYGTGKWKGITGTGKFERIASGKAIEPGTFQGCSRNTGTFELQK